MLLFTEINHLNSLWYSSLYWVLMAPSRVEPSTPYRFTSQTNLKTPAPKKGLLPQVLHISFSTPKWQTLNITKPKQLLVNNFCCVALVPNILLFILVVIRIYFVKETDSVIRHKHCFKKLFSNINLHLFQ